MFFPPFSDVYINFINLSVDLVGSPIAGRLSDRLGRLLLEEKGVENGLCRRPFTGDTCPELHFPRVGTLLHAIRVLIIQPSFVYFMNRNRRKMSSVPFHHTICVIEIWCSPRFYWLLCSLHLRLMSLIRKVQKRCPAYKYGRFSSVSVSC